MSRRDRSPTVRRTAAATLAVAMVLAGCGGGGDEEGGGSTTTVATTEAPAGSSSEETTTSEAEEESTVEGDGFTVSNNGTFLEAQIETGIAKGFVAPDESTAIVVIQGTGESGLVSRLDLESGERVDHEITWASNYFQQGGDPLAPVLAGDAVWIGQPPEGGQRNGANFRGANRVISLDQTTLEPGVEVELPDDGVLDQLVAAGDHVVAFYRTAPLQGEGSVLVDNSRVRWRLQAIEADGTLGEPVDLGGYEPGESWVDGEGRAFARATIAGSPDGSTLVVAMQDHLQVYDLQTLEPEGPAVAGPEDPAASSWSTAGWSGALLGDDGLGYVFDGPDRLVSIPELEDEGTPARPVAVFLDDDEALALGAQMATSMSSLFFTPFTLDGEDVGEDMEFRVECTCSPQAAFADEDFVWVLMDRAVVRVPMDEATRTLG